MPIFIASTAANGILEKKSRTMTDRILYTQRERQWAKIVSTDFRILSPEKFSALLNFSHYDQWYNFVPKSP